MALTNKEPREQGDELYERYVKPLEAEHWGEFVAIAPDGRTMLGTNPYKIDTEAWDAFRVEAVMFQVGEKEIVKPAPIHSSNRTNAISPRIAMELTKLYQQFGKRYEVEHWGEFVAITPDGRTMLGADEHNLFHKAVEVFGTGAFVFQVGQESRD